MRNSQISTVIEKWSEKKIDGKRFNDIFQIDGIPVWYFFEPLIKGVALPRPFKTLAEIEEDVKSGKTATWFGSMKLKLISVGLRKGLLVNEKIKRFISPSERKNADKKDVLFLGYTNEVVSDKKGRLKLIGFGDVIDTLEKKGVKHLVLFCDPLSKNSFRGLLRFPDLLYSYVDSETIKESKKLSNELNQKWKKIRKKGKLFTFNGKNYQPFLENELNFLFSREMLTILITYYLTFKKIIESHKIKIVFLTTLGGFYETLLLGIVYKLNKKAVYSAHGYGRKAFIVRDEFLKNVSFAAWGKEERKRLLKCGIRRENIFVLGSPFFDEIVKYKNEKTRNETKKTVALLTTALVEYKFVEKDEYFDFIRRCLVQIGNAENVKRVIIKLHPCERYKSKYESIVKSLKLKNAEIIQEVGKKILYSVMRDSDLLISFGSTTDIEGLMLDKNIILIEGYMGDEYRKDPYKKAVIQIEKEGDLTGAINKILGDKRAQDKLRKKRNNYIKKTFYKIDGKAHKRVVDLIVSLLNFSNDV